MTAVRVTDERPPIDPELRPERLEVGDHDAVVDRSVERVGVLYAALVDRDQVEVLGQQVALEGQEVVRTGAWSAMDEEQRWRTGCAATIDVQAGPANLQQHVSQSKSA